MNKNYPFSEIQGKITGSQKIIIALPQNPRYDQTAGGLALFLLLTQAGKTVSVICPSAMMVEFNNLVGVDKISPKAKGTDLVVSFNYSMDNVEKISYNDDGGRLNLVVQPKAGAPNINEKSVNLFYIGVGADLLITVGIKNISQLNQSGLSSISPESIINVDNWSDNTNFAAINVIDIDSSSISEIVLGLSEGLGLQLDLDVAQNLLNGLWQVTSGLKKSDLGPDAYEAVATCLRLGAQKPSAEPPAPKQKMWPVAKNEQKVVNVNRSQSNQPSPLPSTPPADWLEPKIYKGSSNV
ncbi:hypothetical protein COV89_02720 [Candidatus Shapirobacteria bacterium CG11_big_fil_rev_8_21_14_0_20_40_12]|uniref:Uncharacterized protein n=2 Tax=Candidatus Shapironibacteriota TaxID=1752721 RepID=A0A2M8GFW2_9BACT|nr:MAG: hypothetical protein COV89_02720 [Candidatus Shapirobacteria bacterium CG11_big_fil_rev_8_21_14_0_20_40_12]PJC76207.1 MAG: hypothetical protein CO010_03275 [Candidatus Shapirobacteria bacterium CG_4_8_14_3_um_filter_39_11]